MFGDPGSWPPSYFSFVGLMPVALSSTLGELLMLWLCVSTVKPALAVAAFLSVIFIFVVYLICN